MTQASWTDEQLSAFLDGELSTDEMDALSRDLEADGALAARLERLGGANATYIAAIGSVDRQPMSAGLKAALAPSSAKVIPFRGKNIAAFVTEHRAIAAGLICAAAVWGVSLTARQAGGIAPDAEGYILASSPLHRVLEETRSSVPVKLGDGVEVTPRLTFATASGDYCRQYQARSGDAGGEAIACRRNDRWRVEVAAYGAVTPNGDYQTASGTGPEALESFIDRVIAGEPLDAGEEADAIRSDWRRR